MYGTSQSKIDPKRKFDRYKTTDRPEKNEAKLDQGKPGYLVSIRYILRISLNGKRLTEINLTKSEVSVPISLITARSAASRPCAISIRSTSL